MSSSPVDEYDVPVLRDFFSDLIDGITGGGTDENVVNGIDDVEDKLFEVSELTMLGALVTECWMVP